MNFPTQEQPNKLLNISKPGLRYDFYYRGTEFKDIHDEIEETLSRHVKWKKEFKQIYKKKTIFQLN